MDVIGESSFTLVKKTQKIEYNIYLAVHIKKRAISQLITLLSQHEEFICPEFVKRVHPKDLRDFRSPIPIEEPSLYSFSTPSDCKIVLIGKESECEGTIREKILSPFELSQYYRVVLPNQPIFIGWPVIIHSKQEETVETLISEIQKIKVVEILKHLQELSDSSVSSRFSRSTSSSTSPIQCKQVACIYDPKSDKIISLHLSECPTSHDDEEIRPFDIIHAHGSSSASVPLPPSPSVKCDNPLITPDIHKVIPFIPSKLRHAPYLCIRTACAEMSGKPTSYLCRDMWCVCLFEPCPFCAMTMLHARVGMVIYAIENTQNGALGSKLMLHECKGLNHRYHVIKCAIK
ncbi:hypothetical protein ADUPG1_014202 [Aduncisulcus paluster]|uniref:CMP/dCMP-type deaminase domain-containing protein n=1 Tax=Aduncisulcus paluster TaxID=2918883 RepID=A0ABQ5KB57_9EUKA|nr:hypothetical protein ADUPG1_014202 [Aduncisulcus paluster]